MTLLDNKLALLASVNAIEEQREPERVAQALAAIAATLDEHTRWHRVFTPGLRHFAMLSAERVPEELRPLFTSIQANARRVLGEPDSDPTMNTAQLARSQGDSR